MLETGAHKGSTTRWLGEAVRPHGHVDSLEIRHDRAEFTAEVCKGLPVTVHTTAALDFTPEGLYDFMFFDSDMESRKAELGYFKRFASNRCIWAVHDTRDHKVQALFRELEEKGRIRRVDLPTPRGITIGRWVEEPR